MNGSRKFWLMGVIVSLSSAAWSADESEAYGTVDAAAGQAIVERHCQSCHQRGIAGAPRTGDSAVWSQRLNERSLETIIDRAYKGYGRMPPKGFCRDCNREDIGAAVVMMLPADQREPARQQGEEK